MDIKHPARKGAHIDILETFILYEETKKNIQLNDKNTVSCNRIFDIILDRDSHLTSQPIQPPSVANELHHSRQQDLAVHISRMSVVVNVI
jgi:hypothetical protein